MAQQVFQTPSVWKGAEFEISAGQLTYNYKGKLITVSLPESAQAFLSVAFDVHKIGARWKIGNRDQVFGLAELQG